MANEIVMVDNTDRKLINILLEDSRLSFRKIAEKAGVSVATVMNRVRRLEREGVIKGYGAYLNYDKLDYDVEAIIEVRIARTRGSPFEVDSFILNHPNVQAVFDVTGVIDHVILVKFQNRRRLNDFLKKINSLPSIETTQTRFILKNFKEAHVRV
jgi:DNA-binding Lrp family transcriptional regulator